MLNILTNTYLQFIPEKKNPQEEWSYPGLIMMPKDE